MYLMLQNSFHDAFTSILWRFYHTVHIVLINDVHLLLSYRSRCSPAVQCTLHAASIALTWLLHECYVEYIKAIIIHNVFWWTELYLMTHVTHINSHSHQIPCNDQKKEKIIMCSQSMIQLIQTYSWWSNECIIVYLLVSNVSVSLLSTYVSCLSWFAAVWGTFANQTKMLIKVPCNSFN